MALKSKILIPEVVIIFLATGFLSFGFYLFYNQNKGALAQEEEIGQILKCEEEIPIGLAIDETVFTAKAISENLEAAMRLSTEQAMAAEKLFQLPEECKAENCQANCHWECGKRDPDTGDCLEWNCVKSPCRGDACPVGQIIAQLNAIEGTYNSINDAYQEIRDIINTPIISLPVLGDVSKTEYVNYLLNISREKMRNCVASADFFLGGEIWGGWLLKCDEVAYQGLLPREKMTVCRDAQEYIQMSADERKKCCYVNNFFCCE